MGKEDLENGIFHKKSRKTTTALYFFPQVLWVLVILAGLATLAQAQTLNAPRYKQGYYSPNIGLPGNNQRQCADCVDGSLPSGDFMVGFGSPSVANDHFSFAIDLYSVADTPPGGFSTAGAFIASFQMHFAFTGDLKTSSCTTIFSDQFLRVAPIAHGGGPLYIFSTEEAFRMSGEIIAFSKYVLDASQVGEPNLFSQLPTNSSNALLVATITCPIRTASGVAGVSLHGTGYTQNSRRLTQIDPLLPSLSYKTRTIAQNNLINYPLDGTSQHLTRVNIHSDGRGADLHFAQSLLLSPNDIDNIVFFLNSSRLTSYTSQVIDTDTLRYRFGNDAELSSEQNIAVARNGDYYGISATLLTAVPYTFYADAPIIVSKPAINASNTKVTVRFDTALYDDPVGASAFRVVLTTTSSAISTATVSSVTATSNTGEYVLSISTTNPATGTERFGIELILDGVGSAAQPYRAAYPYQSTATNIAFNDFVGPAITSAIAFDATRYSTSRDVRITASDPSGVASVGFTQSTLSAIQACASTDTTTLNIRLDNGSTTSVTAIHTFNKTTVYPIFVCAFAVDNANNRTTATTTMVVVVTNIDRDIPTISIDGPPSAASSRVTITGRVSSQETTSSSVSGLASFGYTLQRTSGSCTTSIQPTTTLTNPITNPHALLVFSTTENGVRLCFIAIDNAGNARAVASKATTRIDVAAPQYTSILRLSSENSVLEVVYIESNNIAFTPKSQTVDNRGIRVDVLDQDSIRGSILSTATVSETTLRIEMNPMDISASSSTFTIDGVRGVLVDSNGIARSRTGAESYRVTIPANTIQDSVGNIVRVETIGAIKLVQNSSPVLVTLGSRDANGAVAYIGVQAVEPGYPILTGFIAQMVFSEVITTPSAIQPSDFRIYEFRDKMALTNAQIGNAAAVITPNTSQLSITTTINSSQTSIDLAFDAIPGTRDTVGYLIGFINDGSASGGCYPTSSSGSYPHPNRENGDTCLGASQILLDRIMNLRVFLGGAF